MRVLLVAGTFPPGRCGVGDYVQRLAQALARAEGLEVAVLTQADVRREPIDGVEVFGEARSWRLHELPRLVRRMRAWKPQLVHIHWPSQGFGSRITPALLAHFAKRLGARVVQTWHEPWPAHDAWRMRLQRRPTDALVFVRPDFERLMPPALLPDMPDGPRAFIASAGSLQRSCLGENARRELRARYLQGRDALVVFFGFVYPAKGVELLFGIADPRRHALVIAGSVLDAPYRARLEDLARAAGWEGRVHYTGYLEPGPAADLLFAADAVVLPFLAGGGEWNTSIHGALAQGTLVITTSSNPRGDDPDRNLYTAPVGDVDAMRCALAGLAGRRVDPPADDGWGRIARAHTALYDKVTAPGR